MLVHKSVQSMNLRKRYGPSSLHEELICYSLFVICIKYYMNTIGALDIHWSYPACAARRPHETTLFGIEFLEDAFRRS